MRRAGFTLIEALLAVALIGGLIGIVCSVFEIGSSSFKVGHSRLGLQSELRRIVHPLRRDLTETSFQSAASLALPDSEPGPQRRDALACNALTGPITGDSFDLATGLPKWNCYLVYWGSEGKLYRAVFADPTVTPISTPLQPFGPGDLSPTNPRIRNREVRALSDCLATFQVQLDLSNQMIKTHLRLRAENGHTEMGGKPIVEELEVDLSIQPDNTWPKL